MKTQLISCKEKVPGAAVGKESDVGSLLKKEMTHHIELLEKVLVKTVNLIINSLGKIHLYWFHFVSLVNRVSNLMGRLMEDVSLIICGTI